MAANRRRRRVEPTDEWGQLELLCGWPEQRDYELIRPMVLFGSPAWERVEETGAASERTLQRRAVRFEVERWRAWRASSGHRVGQEEEAPALGEAPRRGPGKALGRPSTRRPTPTRSRPSATRGSADVLTGRP